jgi:hypothetical protein
MTEAPEDDPVGSDPDDTWERYVVTTAAGDSALTASSITCRRRRRRLASSCESTDPRASAVQASRRRRSVGGQLDKRRPCAPPIARSVASQSELCCQIPDAPPPTPASRKLAMGAVVHECGSDDHPSPWPCRLHGCWSWQTRRGDRAHRRAAGLVIEHEASAIPPVPATGEASVERRPETRELGHVGKNLPAC